jgi:CPA1 family monovalent cation:H+ antiporter
VRGFEIVLALVVVATVVAALADRLRAPAPSLLVIAGLAIGTVPGVPDVQLRPEVVAIGVLPPLLYAAATDAAMSELRRVLGSVSALAVGLVAASAVAVAFVTHAMFPQVSPAAAFVLGAVLASTDPIAVSALARSMHLPPRLLALVQGESLLNDVTSLVLFRVAIRRATAGAGYLCSVRRGNSFASAVAVR